MGPIWGGATLVGRLSGIRTQSGQTKINNVLTAQIFPPNLEMRAVPRLVSFTHEAHTGLFKDPVRTAL